MKVINILILLLSMSVLLKAQTVNPGYDSLLAKKLGADDFGMKKYVFVMLKTGENATNDRKFIDSCFRGHMENIKKLVKENKLVVAGPFFKNEKSYRGLFIFSGVSLKEAESLLETDPAVNAKLLQAEVYEWYGSAALSVYIETAEKIAKYNP